MLQKYFPFCLLRIIRRANVLQEKTKKRNHKEVIKNMISKDDKSKKTFLSFPLFNRRHTFS